MGEKGRYGGGLTGWDGDGYSGGGGSFLTL